MTIQNRGYARNFRLREKGEGEIAPFAHLPPGPQDNGLHVNSNVIASFSLIVQGNPKNG